MSTHAPLLGAFLTPSLFYGGAAAVSIPIIIHLLARRRFKRIRWAAMEFLIDAERRNRRRIRMEEWILLALRCLAVLFLGMLVARPFLRPAGAAALLGGTQRTERVFVLDDSLSMSYRGTAGGTCFDRAKEGVRRLLESIRRETPDDTVTLIRMSAPTTPVDAGTYLDDRQTEELLARLEAIPASQRFVDPAAAIEGLVEVLERSPDVTHAAVYVVSDFQKNQWVQREAAVGGTDKSGGALEPLAKWAGQAERGLHLVLINVGDEEAANLAITDLAVPGGQLVAGASGTLRATVANFAAQSAGNLELHASVGAFPQPSKTLPQLESQQSAVVDLSAEFLRAGFDAVRVELPPDGLSGDNSRVIAVDVASAVRILIVNGEPSADSYDDEVTYLATALRPEGEVFSGNEVVTVDETQFEETNLSAYHLVVLANVYRIGEAGVESLERFVRGGGGLLVFLGDQVDPDFYNAAMHRGGEGILPTELKEMVRAADAAHLRVADRLHPAMQGLSQEGDPLGLGQVAFFQYFSNAQPTSKPAGGAEGDTDAAAASDSTATRVVARFDDALETPAIVEGMASQGRVVMVMTGADREWHQWPDHPTFLPIVLELSRHVARRSDAARSFLVGEPIELPLDPSSFEGDAMVRTPGYPNESEVSLTAAADAEGRGLKLTWDHTHAAGVYQFVLRQRDGGEVLRPVAVNVDPRESDLAVPAEDELRRALSGIPFEYIVGIDRLAGTAGEPRIELWRACLFVVAVALMAEQTLAWWWGRRR